MYQWLNNHSCTFVAGFVKQLYLVMTQKPLKIIRGGRACGSRPLHLIIQNLKCSTIQPRAVW